MPLLFLAAVDLASPMLWAILIGWILTVVLHEFAHGVVAYWGGDFTIRERGGLSLNPIQYIDPIMSIALPAVFLLMGGIPLPGGATYIRRDLLRNKGWESAVALAGPAMNLLLFFACALPFHPSFGWFSWSVPVSEWTNFQVFLGAMAVLQIIAVVLNLVPVPPLDGFQAISPFLPDEWREKVATPPLSTVLFFAYFMAVWRGPLLGKLAYPAMDRMLEACGFGDHVVFFYQAISIALYGQR